MERMDNGMNQAADGANRKGPDIPSISLPTGGGAVRGIGETFAANPVTGTGTLTVPLPLSPGRGQFGPRLSLTYDSGAGNGAFGYGWNLSLPSITRRTEKGLPQYRDEEESDVYMLSGAEHLVPVPWTDGDPDVGRPDDGEFRIDRYRPRTEGLFARIERWTHKETGAIHWRSISRDNVTSLYGRTEMSRIADPQDARRIFAWLICERFDDKGNAVVYEYKAEDGGGVDASLAYERNRERTANRYLKRIRYGNRVSRLIEPDLTGMEWMFEAVFDYGEGHCEALDPDGGEPGDGGHRQVRASAQEQAVWAVRPDPFSSYRAGFEIRTYRRCRRMLMFHRFAELGDAPCLVRSAEFAYRDFDYGAAYGVEDELGFQGSTRSASFLQSVTHAGYVRDTVPERGGEDGGEVGVYLARSFPPLAFTYSRARIQEDIRELDADSLANLPVGADGSAYRWVDLEGEGLAGVLAEQAGAWYYKPNLGGGRLGPQRLVAALPPLADDEGGAGQLLDLDGDGRLEWTRYAGPTPGFARHAGDGQWGPYRTFDRLPAIRWNDSALRFVDLNGDGRADILVAKEEEAFAWYPSLGEEGFGTARRAALPDDGASGPGLVPGDDTQGVFLADMSGDGLADLVRVRSGEVSYRPNLGYGRFGARITMEDAPGFDHPDRFDPRRVLLADIDGSGTADIIYLGRDGVRVYFNQSGNRWSGPRRLDRFPRADNVSSVAAVDLLGNGTSCLVWSSPLPGPGPGPMRYMDLMGGCKPHLLTGIANNMGTETVIQYASSTKFYLADEREGRPWTTRLPFPVQVAERVETWDRIGGNRFVTRYAYHDGYYDGVEREFRGFGLVEQWDTESFAALAGGSPASTPEATNEKEASHMPPVWTRTWYHTGAYPERSPFDDTVLPAEWTAEERREACRALKGAMLRQETYALDGSDREPYPYTVTERHYALRRLHPKRGGRHAVFHVEEREAIARHYDRRADDPRVTHRLTLETDSFGNVLKSASIGYGRRYPDPGLEPRDQAQQAEIHILYMENEYTNGIGTSGDYRTPLPAETRTYELFAPALQQAGCPYPLAAVREACAGAAAIGYEMSFSGEGPQKRLLKRVRTLYRRNDLAGPLPLRRLESKALPYESYKLAFTAGLLDAAYGGRVEDAMLADEGAFVRLDGDGSWWIPSGRSFYSAGEADSPERELAEAESHFYLARRYRDPFHTASAGTEVLVRYDGYDLLVAETRDALGNRVVAEENDYRVLQPTLVTDPNGNRSGVRFDALGLVAGTAVMGKAGLSPAEGDSLAGFRADLTERETLDYLRDPLSSPHVLLGRATSRVVYDLFAYMRTARDPQPQPSAACTLTRETHDAELADGQLPAIRHVFSYWDGFGRELQIKTLAEPGPVPARDPASGKIDVMDGMPSMTEQDASPRWAGSGWKVYNNKGLPVRRYEPFFTDTHRYESDVRIGNGPLLFHDPVGRVAAVLHPDHTWVKTVFDPWRLTQWDTSDTVLIASPADDPEAGGYFRRLREEECLPTWHGRRMGGELGAAEQDAARKAAVHAGTPAVAYLDALGRPFLSVEHNRFARSGSSGEEPVEEFYRTRIRYDIEGNQREVSDARGRVVMRCQYDMLGNPVYRYGMDSGERWVLHDVSGRQIRTWNGRGVAGRIAYDALRRPVGTYVSEAGGAFKLVVRTVYGEEMPDPERNNLRGQVAAVMDQAGKATSDAYDFKGNPTRTSRQLACAYSSTLDWSGEVPLEERVYISRTRYDALNRPTEIVAPDRSAIRSGYNESGLLQSVQANIRGETAADGSAVWTPFVTNVDYDAKGRRTAIAYGNGAATILSYDPLTSRLSLAETRRGGDCLQRMRYTYDPAGNITHIRDEAQQTAFFRNKRVDPDTDYTYDALYRLIAAAGREHLGQNGGLPGPPVAPDAFGAFHARLAHPGDGSALGTYRERYVYDAVGNLLQLQHRGNDPAHPGWSRGFRYASDSNRLLGLDGVDGQQLYDYDAHGNLTRMPHLPLMQWDYGDRLRATAGQTVPGGGTPETTWYVYDAAGTRVRKVIDRPAAAGHAPVRRKERIYFGLFEIYREYGADGREIGLERETLHLMDGGKRLALAETRTQGDDGSPARLIRYQLANHLGSSSLELDQAARIVSYEEYFPFGSTSYQAVRSQTEAPKRYRYSGKERDEESGLYYHEARYYAPDICRWTSPDPLGIKDGINPFAAFHNNPIRYVDPSGRTNTPYNFVEYAESMEGGLKRMAELGLRDQKEYGLARDPATNRLMLLEGGRNSVYFGELIPLGHTHTGVDLTVGPSDADLNEIASKKVPRHWIYSENEGWGRISYDAKTNTFEMLKSKGGELFRSVIRENPRYGSPPVEGEPIQSRWSHSEFEPVGRVGAFDPETFREETPARRGPGKSGSRGGGGGEPPKGGAPEPVKAGGAEPIKGGAPEPAARSLPARLGAAADAAAPVVGKGLAVAGTAYAAYDIASKTEETAREQGALMGAAQMGKTSAKHATAVLWFAAGGAIALTLVTGGAAAPLAAAVIGAAFATAGTVATHQLIDDVTPGLR